FVFASVFNGLFAQKPNTKNVKIEFIQPPIKPFPDNVKTYFVKMINNAANLPISPDSEQNNITLRGYERATNENEADVIFKMTINSVRYDNAVKKVTYKQKVNDSTYVDKTGGQFTVNAYLSTSYHFKDQKNDKFLGSGAGKADVSTFTSPTYNTYNEAVSASNETKSTEAKKLYGELFKSAKTKFSNRINDDFGFPIKTQYFPIARGKGKKHDYADLEGAYNKFVEVGKILDENHDIEKVRPMVEEAIKVWEKAAGEYVSGSKKARVGDKNIGHIYTNLAVGNFVIEKWDQSLDYVAKSRKHKGQAAWADYLDKTIKRMRERYAKEPAYAAKAKSNTVVASANKTAEAEETEEDLENLSHSERIERDRRKTANYCYEFKVNEDNVIGKTGGISLPNLDDKRSFYFFYKPGKDPVAVFPLGKLTAFNWNDFEALGVVGDRMPEWSANFDNVKVFVAFEAVKVNETGRLLKLADNPVTTERSGSGNIFLLPTKYQSTDEALAEDGLVTLLKKHFDKASYENMLTWKE
ncbi:MAG: hypothetical protein AAFX87_26905, partial [Bacteroidota bacterium]